MDRTEAIWSYSGGIRLCFLTGVGTASAAMVLMTAWLVLWPIWQTRQTKQALKVLLDGKHGVGVTRDTILVAGSVVEETRDALSEIERRGGARSLGMIVEDEAEEVDLRLIAAHMLAGMGVQAKSAIPALARATKSENDNVRTAATIAMRRVNPEG